MLVLLPFHGGVFVAFSTPTKCISVSLTSVHALLIQLCCFYCKELRPDVWFSHENLRAAWRAALPLDYPCVSQAGSRDEFNGDLQMTRRCLAHVPYFYFYFTVEQDSISSSLVGKKTWRQQNEAVWHTRKGRKMAGLSPWRRSAARICAPRSRFHMEPVPCARVRESALASRRFFHRHAVGVCEGGVHDLILANACT